MSKLSKIRGKVKTKWKESNVNRDSLGRFAKKFVKNNAGDIASTAGSAVGGDAGKFLGGELVRYVKSGKKRKLRSYLKENAGDIGSAAGGIVGGFVFKSPIGASVGSLVGGLAGRQIGKVVTTKLSNRSKKSVSKAFDAAAELEKLQKKNFSKKDEKILVEDLSGWAIGTLVNTAIPTPLGIAGTVASSYGKEKVVKIREAINSSIKKRSLK